MTLVRIMILILLPPLVAGSMSGCATVTHAAAAKAEATPAEPPPPGAARLSEELWIIAREQTAQQRTEHKDVLPGAATLLARVPDQPAPVAIPLKRTDVKAEIAGYIASVNVAQQFHNPFSSKIEAIYVFPLPRDAAVNEFIMTIGPRKIRGVIRERAEAQRLYQLAKAQGYVASLMTQERANLFTQAVANIEPGKQIDIEIKYLHTLEYTGGWFEWRFPMKAAKSTARAGRDVSVAVHLDAGATIEQVETPGHRTDVRTTGGRAAADVTLARSDDAVANEDFILRYRVAGDHGKSPMVAAGADERPALGLLVNYLSNPSHRIDPAIVHSLALRMEYECLTGKNAFLVVDATRQTK